MRSVSVTEASRSLAALLEVERGETVIITRDGRRIAAIGPASSGNGAALLALAAAGDIAFDPGLALDVASARAAVRGACLMTTDGRARFDDLPGVPCVVAE